jgi:hypothetical protein
MPSIGLLALDAFFRAMSCSAVEGDNNVSWNLDDIVLPVEGRRAMAKEVEHGRNHCREQIDLFIDGSVIDDSSAPGNTIDRLA